MRRTAKLTLLLALVSSSALLAGSSHASKQTLAKAKDIAAQHFIGGQVMWGKHGAVIKGIKLPTPLVQDWSTLNKRGWRGPGDPMLRNLQLKLARLDADGKEASSSTLVDWDKITALDSVDSTSVGEVVAIDDSRGIAAWLLARTLDTSNGWRTVLVEMQVLATKVAGRVRRKEHAIEPYLQLVHEDELLFRD